MTTFEIRYIKKGEKEPCFTTTREANNATEALQWADKQLTMAADKDAIIEISEDAF